MAAKRILFVDDDDDIRAVAQMSLELVGGWEVMTASCGREGLDQAVTAQPDAILLDVMMPEMDGPTTFRHLQANQATQHIPVVFLTAKVQATDQQLFANLRVQGVITKPFDPMTLPTQIATTLGWGV